MFGFIEKYLKYNNYNNELRQVKENWLSHPNFPSLLAITDSLSNCNIKNIAANVPYEYLDKLPDSFLVELKGKNKVFHFLEKNKINITIIDEKNNSKIITRNELENLWTGVVLIIERNEDIQKNKSSNSIILTTLLLVIGFIIIYANKFSIIESIFLLLSLIGIFITIEIVKTYFQENHITESKFCNLKKKFSCNETIKSNKYVFSKYIEFVDLPVIFFASTFFGLLFSLITINTTGLISSFSIPIIAYSFYVQKKILKKWCVLCLLISLILITNSLLFLIFQISFKFLVLKEIVWFMVITGVWIFIKKQMLTNKESKSKINSLLRFKRNEDVFNAVSLNIIDNEGLKELPKFTIGNTDSQNILTLFLSPSCPHCHTVFKEALVVLEKHSEKVKLEIAYNLNINNINNPYLDIPKITMQLVNNKKDYVQALKDWHINQLDIEVWKSKWLQDKEFSAENEQLEKQFQWCSKNEFNYAPVKIFNGKILSKHYEINELLYFFK